VSLAQSYREKLHLSATPNDGELAAFLGYALCFPDAFLALVDTYNTLKSGIPNFLAVALALRDCGYAAKGVRLDSGDIAYLSKETRKLFCAAAEQFSEPSFRDFAVRSPPNMHPFHVSLFICSDCSQQRNFRGHAALTQPARPRSDNVWYRNSSCHLRRSNSSWLCLQACRVEWSASPEAKPRPVQSYHSWAQRSLPPPGLRRYSYS
jgi:hypothetical protein